MQSFEKLMHEQCRKSAEAKDFVALTAHRSTLESVRGFALALGQQQSPNNTLFEETDRQIEV
jgi:hypothetical protein